VVRRPSPAVYRHPRIDELLEVLPDDHLYQKFIEDMELVLMENMYAGEKVLKRNIPPNINEKYTLQQRSPNLYVYDLSGGHRGCYILSSHPECEGPVPYVLDIMNHDDYNKLFGYKIK